MKTIFTFIMTALSLTTLLGTANAAHAGNRHPALQPRWSKSEVIQNSPNSSLLRTLDPLLSQPSIESKIFDSRVSAEMRQRYNDLNRNYDMRKNHDLVSAEEERAHSAELSTFSKTAMRAYGNKHVSAKLKNVEKTLRNDRFLAQPVSIVAAAAAVYTGQELKYKVNEDTRISGRTDGPNRQANFSLFSSVVDSTVDYKAAPGDEKSADLLAQHETMKVSLGRGLPLWDLRSGLSYGASSASVTASLSKQLSENLTCVVDSSRSARTNQGQEAVKVFYGLSF